MTILEVTNLTLDLPILSWDSRSLRRTFVGLSLGGQAFKTRSNKVSIRALDNISFTLMEGERVGLVGHNGSGKSSLLRVLAGIYTPSAGSVRMDGRPTATLDPATGMDLEAPGIENIFILGRIQGRTREQIASVLDWIGEFTGLGPFLDAPVKTYSAGMTARLAFAVATAFDPDILLMDEWIATGDEAFIGKAQDKLNDFVSRSRALVLATHNKEIIRRVCNKAMLLDKGRVVAFGPVEEVFEAQAQVG